MIGLCATTQIISWDQETKLWDGVPFDINFSQDFSVACIDGRALTGIPMDEVFRALLNPHYPQCGSRHLKSRSAAEGSGQTSKSKKKKNGRGN